MRPSPTPALRLAATLAFILVHFGGSPGAAQVPHALAIHLPEESILDLDRPRIAAGPDGSFAVAFEILTQGQFEASPRWKVAVQRYSPQGDPVGPLNVFRGESCSSLDIWTFDWMEHAEVAFRPDGILVVLMQHAGRFSLGGVDDVGSAEATIGAIDAQGQIIRLTNRADCVQHKLIFPGGSRQDRPRMAMLPGGGMLVTADGFFNGTNFRNVAIRVLDADLNQLVDQAIPHDDPGSDQAVHRNPDIASNGSILLSTWHQCPLLDAHGNTAPCDVGVQFGTIAGDGSLQALGGNMIANAGAPPASYSLWPSAAMNTAGNSVVVWADTRTGMHGEIFGQRFNAAGQRVGDNFQVSAAQGVVWNRPEVALLDDGRFMVVWTDSSSAGFNARGRQYDAGGIPMSAPYRLMEEAGAQSGIASVARAGDAFILSYLGRRAGEDTRVYTSNRAAPVSSDPERPAEVALLSLASFPNPFHGRTTVSFELETAAVARLTVFDFMGREIATPLNEHRAPGRHEVVFDAGSLAAGVYQYRFEAGAAVRTGRLVLLK